MKLAGAEQMRALDQAAIWERGIPSLELMERAAQAAVAQALAEAQGVHRAAVFCGSGNNGGDGVAAARLLRAAGLEVRCFLAGRREKLTPDCREMVRRWEETGGKLEDFTGSPEQAAWCAGCGVLVDALFGIGLNTELRGLPLAAVELMNACPAPTLAVDLPSGVEADTGQVLGVAVEAAATVTFTLPKPGLLLGEGGTRSGRIIVAGIGIPTDLVREVGGDLHGVFPEELSLPRRRRDSHKGDYGKSYILGGSVGYSGAPVLAAQAAVRSGGGLVSVGVPAPVWPVAGAKLDEAMPHPLPANREGGFSLEAAEEALRRMEGCGVCLIGPGLGRSNSAASVVRRVLRAVHLPVVLDADGINALEGHIDVLDARRGACTVLTPHDGEFIRLSGAPVGEDRLAAARAFAAEHGCVLVLKGHRTITAFPDGAAYVNATGNPGMAKGGSGDVLSGILLSFLGQGMPPRLAVPMAVCVHGMAGDLCAGELGEYGMTPGDIIGALPRVLKALEGRRGAPSL